MELQRSLLSVSNFLFKTKHLNLIAKCIAPIGLLFTCLAILTGSLWGQPTWGTWWVWDARITSMLILMIFYILYILSNKLIVDETKAIKISSLIAIIGAVNIPIIKMKNGPTQSKRLLKLNLGFIKI